MHCLVNPAGFWVSDKDSTLIRRPWCLSRCQDLDRDLCDMIPFGSVIRRAVPRHTPRRAAPYAAPGAPLTPHHRLIKMV
jgi:hypothetical protein